ncbi:MAG: phosphoglycerate mutase family protein [bacterium]|nr:phosphoglycerate mutase family protein [bacterium]
MDFFVTVRHGDYGPGGLSHKGVSQITELAGLIMNRFGTSGKTAVFTSPTVRAKQSAEIVSQFFEVTPTVIDDLANDHPVPAKAKDIIDFIIEKAGDANLVIAVSHFYAPATLVLQMAKKFGFDLGIDSWETAKGKANVFDCKAVGITRI